MKKYWKIAALGGLGLAVLVLAGYAGGGRSGEPAVSGDDPFAGPDDVSVSIDRALGREQVGMKQSAAQESGRSSVAVAPAPALGAPAGSAADSPAAAKVAGGVTATAPEAAPLASVDDRTIVQTASVRLQVKNVGGSFEEIGRIAAAGGGFVASSNFAFQGEQQVASITIRVPAAKYQETLSQVRALGAKVDAETSNASDVTEEYSDLSARIRNLEATETQLLQLLSQAKNVSEVLQVQDRINSVRNEIERVKGRISLLDKLSDLATISVQLRPVAAPVKADNGGVNLGEEVSRAWNDSIEFLGGIAAGVLSVVVFSWWLLPLSVPAAVAWQRWSRGRPAPKAATYD